MYKNIILISILILGFTKMLGQEKEIHKEKVSIAISNFIKEHYPKAKHVRYYEDNEEGKKIVECDFKVKKDKYSLKFFEDRLIETEKAIKFKTIPAPTKANIQITLDSQKTKKILECEEIQVDQALHYEIKTKTSRDNFYELLFDASGKLISKKETILNPIPSSF